LEMGNGEWGNGEREMGKWEIGNWKWEILGRMSFCALKCVSRLAFASSRYIRFANTR
jgi:hypothetical protein